MKKYVVLEHLTLPHRGIRFWTHNGENNTHFSDGSLVYKEILFTDSQEEAIFESQLIGDIPSYNELEEYYKNELYENKQKEK